MEKAPKKRVAKKVVGKTATGKSTAPKKAVVKKVATKKKVVSDTLKSSKKKKLEKHPLSAKKEALVTKIATKSEAVTIPVLKKTHSSKKSSSGTSEPNDGDTVKMITGTPSLRLRSRVAAYKEWYEERSSEQVRRIAVVFGYVFMMFGTFSVFAFSSPATMAKISQFASSGCLDPAGTAICDPSLLEGEASSTSPIQVPSPEIIFPTTGIQIEPVKDSILEIAVRNAVGHMVHVVSQRNGTRMELSLVERSGDDRYKYKIPSATMEPGEYRVIAKAKNSLNVYSEFLGPFFVVPVRISETTTATSGTGTSSSSQSTTQTTQTTVTSDSSTTEIKSTSTTTTQDEITQTDEQSHIKVEDSVLYTQEPLRVMGSEEIEVESELLRTPTPTTEPVPAETPATFELQVKLSPGAFPGQHKIEIIPTFRHTSVEVYIRRINSTQPQFLGTATKATNGWLYWLDSSSFPSGNYTLIVRGLDGKEIKEVKEIPFANTTTKPTYTTEPAYTTTKESIENKTVELAKSTSSPIAPLVDPRKPLLPTLLTSPYQSTGTPIERTVEVEKAREILKKNSSDFNVILRSYGSAMQTGDEKILRLAESAISERIYTVLANEVVDSEFEDSIYTLEADIRREIEEVKEQIKKVETFKKERTATASSVDTDNDGVSDFDEYLLYNTDSNNPDTDNDGVIDGVEIGLGYDPTDEKSEAIIRFDSPKEVSYEDDTLLGIKTVQPLLVYETDTDVPDVQSEIHGFGLPNSFVTLYIFSDPIVVTVKTKDDGSFSYTFSKELEDGDHEVYAALTDNKGQIVVRSTAFRFVKTAEAYTYVDAADETATVLTEGGLTSTERTYNIVAAMGILSFGLILLMLGATLRQDRQKLMPSGV